MESSACRATRHGDEAASGGPPGRCSAQAKSGEGSSSSGIMNRTAAAQPAQGEDVIQSGRKVKRQAEAKAVANPRLEPPPASSQGSEPQGHKMKRPAACSQAAPRPVQGQAKPKVEKPSGSSSSHIMNRPAAAQPAPGEDVVRRKSEAPSRSQGRRKAKIGATACQQPRGWAANP